MLSNFISFLSNQSHVLCSFLWESPALISKLIDPLQLGLTNNINCKRMNLIDGMVFCWLLSPSYAPYFLFLYMLSNDPNFSSDTNKVNYIIASPFLPIRFTAVFFFHSLINYKCWTCVLCCVFL